MGRQIGIFRIPKSAEEIIKGTDAGSIAEFKTAEDCIKGIDLQLSSPVCQGMDLVFFVKYFSLKKASEFPFFSKGFSLPSAGIMHPCA